MARVLERDEVRRWIAEGAQLVDVLPEPEYRHAHLPGALSLPLKNLDRSEARLNKSLAVVVYCSNSL